MNKIRRRQLKSKHQRWATWEENLHRDQNQVVKEDLYLEQLQEWFLDASQERLVDKDNLEVTMMLLEELEQQNLDRNLQSSIQMNHFNLSLKILDCLKALKSEKVQKLLYKNFRLLLLVHLLKLTSYVYPVISKINPKGKFKIKMLSRKLIMKNNIL